MAALEVESSQDIQAGPEDIRRCLTDFQTWPAWSPWLYTEPETALTYTGTAGEPGHGYSWQGQKVGAGSMSLLSADEHTLQYKLNFLKPFKSEADVSFSLEEAGHGTRVTWTMLSKLPFFMFFFKGVMAGMIRSDYRRGLLMLKDYIETDHVPSKADFHSVTDVPSTHYLGHSGTARMTELSASLEESFTQLMGVVQNDAIAINGPPQCVYHKLDIKRDICHYTVALPVADAVSIAAPFQSEQRPACRALKLVHTGAYRHLGSGWSAIMSEARAGKHRPHRTIKPFEIYLNDPDETPEAELLTEIYLPLR